MKLVIFCILLSLTSCVSAQNDKSPTVSGSQEIKKEGSKDSSIIEFCEMLQSPEKFEKETIRVKAIYRYGFEWSEFYSLKCEMKKRVWVEGVETPCENTAQTEKWEAAGMGGRTYGIIAVGNLIEKPDGYGHMNSYNYLFKMECFQKNVLLDRDGYLPLTLDSEHRRSIEEFERSNN